MSHSSRPPGGRHLALLPATLQKMLLARATLADLKQRYPSRHLDVMAVASLTDLAARFPEVENVWTQPEPGMGWPVYRQAGLALANKGYSHAWVLPDRFKLALIPMQAGIPERTGYRGRYRYSLINDMRLPRRWLHAHPVDRYRALAWEVGKDPLPESQLQPLTVDEARQEALLQEHGLTIEQPVLAWCPGRLLVPRQAARVAADARQLQPVLQQALDQGWQVWLLASRHERPEVQRLLEQLEPALVTRITNLAGHLGLTDLVDLLSLARLQIGQDNPLALLGRACDLPVLLPVQADVLPKASEGFAARCGAQWLHVAELTEQLSRWY